MRVKGIEETAAAVHGAEAAARFGLRVNFEPLIERGNQVYDGADIGRLAIKRENLSEHRPKRTFSHQYRSPKPRFQLSFNTEELLKRLEQSGQLGDGNSVMAQTHLGGRVRVPDEDVVVSVRDKGLAEWVAPAGEPREQLARFRNAMGESWAI